MTHLVRDETVPDSEPRLARAAELGAIVLGLSEATAVLGFGPAPARRTGEPAAATQRTSVLPDLSPAVAPPVPRPVQATAQVVTPPPAPPVAVAPRTVKVLGGRILMGTGLLLMFIVVVAMFAGSPLAAGIFLGALGVGALLGGWWIAEPAPR